MPSFHGVNNPNIVVTVSDRDEVQVCPKCTFPNDAAARACADCGHPLQDGSGRWVPARLIRKCTNPACEAFVCTKDSKCKKCGHSTYADAEVICNGRDQRHIGKSGVLLPTAHSLTGHAKCICKIFLSASVALSQFADFVA